MDIKTLESEYQKFYTPTFKILVGENGEEKERNIVNKGVEVISLNVDNTLDGADTFSFTVFNAFDITNKDITKKEVLWFGDDDDSLFKFGKQVEIKLGYANNIKTLMIGLITSVKVDFPSGSPPQMEVSGFDLSYKMMKEKKPRSWDDDRTDSYVVKNIAEEYSLKTSFDDDLDYFLTEKVSKIRKSNILKLSSRKKKVILNF
ncbi:MAG: hypothetical protein QNJ32_29675 [Xenococcaceae cyanobacterium MO_167.B27]|nr:hypothetical protein [Xenococcaceae cyanobacterium MO_167.B27]